MTDHELTRRDALEALTAIGAASYALSALTWNALENESDEQPGLTPHERETLIAVAETVYPDEVTGIPDFLERYVVGRAREDPDRIEGIASAIDILDDQATDWFGETYAELDSERRDEALRQSGAEIADPDPEGITPERIRFYLVNELLYALYTTPTGGELVGIENPQGHPGGTDSYQKRPGTR